MCRGDIDLLVSTLFVPYLYCCKLLPVLSTVAVENAAQHIDAGLVSDVLLDDDILIVEENVDDM